jgi:hypothetical protein
MLGVTFRDSGEVLAMFDRKTRFTLAVSQFTVSMNIFVILMVAERFWVDLCLKNPLDAGVSLSKITLIIEEVGKNEVSLDTYLEIETIDEVVMNPAEKRVVSVSFYSIHGPYSKDSNSTDTHWDKEQPASCVENSGRQIYVFRAPLLS